MPVPTYVRRTNGVDVNNASDINNLQIGVEDLDARLSSLETFNVKDYGALGNGSTNDFSAFSDAIDDIPAAGGRMVIPNGVYRLSQSLIFTKPIILTGSGAGRDAALRPTELNFDSGVSGIVLAGQSKKSRVSDLALVSDGGGSGVGIRCRGTRALIEHVHIENFGSHGLFFDTALTTPTSATASGTTATITLANHGYQVGEQLFLTGFTPSGYNSTSGTKYVLSATSNTFTIAVANGTTNATVLGQMYAGNCNVSKASMVTSIFNDGNGIRIEGNDSNRITLDTCDCSGNADYGYHIAGAKNYVTAPHANGNTAGDFYVASSSHKFESVYSEGNGNFDIFSSATHGSFEGAGIYAAPTVRWYTGGAFSENFSGAISAGWSIQGASQLGVLTSSAYKAHARDIRVIDPAGTGLLWRINAGAAAADVFSISLDGVGTPLQINALGDRITIGDSVDLDIGATDGTKIGINATRKLGFYGATPIVQPSANPDTSGLTLPQLETEVNQLKATLRALGLLAP